MKFRRLALAALVALLCASSVFATPKVVISQVYGGGGNSLATLKNDFIEIFNSGDTSQDLTGWSVQYASSTGTSWQTTALSGPLAPGQYYLIKEAAGSGGTVDLPAPDATGGINMSGTTGKVALVSNTTALTCGSTTSTCLTNPAVIDFVGFGSASNFEGTGPTGALSNTTAAVRAFGGCTDSDNNAADFAVDTPNPRNTSAAFHPCSGALTLAISDVTAAEGNSGTTVFHFAVTLSSPAPAGGVSFTIATQDGTGTTANNDYLAKSASATIAAGATAFDFPVTVIGDTNVEPDETFFVNVTGVTAGVTVAKPQGVGTITNDDTALVRGIVHISQVYGGGGNTGAPLKNDFIELYNPGATAVSLTGWSVQYASSSGTSWSSTLLSGTIPAGGYYLVQEAGGSIGAALPTPDATGSISMAASSGKVALVNNGVALTGTCPVSVTIDFVGFGTSANCSEGSGPTANLSNTTAALRKSAGAQDTDDNASDFTAGTPAPHNSIPPPPPPSEVVISQVYGGGGNSGATLKNDFIELFNRTNAPITIDGWSVQYFSSTSSTWSATPLTGTIPAHSYYLVGEAAGAGGSVDLPTPDITGGLFLGAGSGRIALVNSTALLTGSCPATAAILDLVVYGNGSCAEGTSIGNLSNTTAAFRRVGGCRDNNDNAADFFVAAPAPRNSATAANDCSTAVEPVPAPHVVISQIYGGGGNSGGVYQDDFVELYNPTSNPASLEGWSIQYASATGNTWGNNSQPLGGTIEAGGYFLVQFAGGTNVAPLVPSPRIISGIGLGASAGKLALVTHVLGLNGNCPIGDPALVDFVGYGSTADCYEGGVNAPAPSNSTAILRQNNGALDTDHNSSDFFAGAPNPRGSGALIPLPPFITLMDPLGANAPFDASVTINFSEPVNATGPWFSINCSATGPHGDVEVASAFSGDTWILTPNVTFQPGETCSVHIARDLITDNESNPLVVNGDWTFTIATAPPVETADVHLTMGNPSGASLNDENNYLMQKPEYAESYNRSKATPNWVSWHLTDAWTVNNSNGRTDTFRPDPALPATWYRVLQTDFSGSGFDRGHMCPSADRVATIPVNQATFLMSNMVPQTPANNQGPWVLFEDYLRTLVPANEVYIVSGPDGEAGKIANQHVTVPAATWKVALVLPKVDGNDVARVNASTRTIAIRIPNINGIISDDWSKYETTVRSVEGITGYNFFSNVPQIVQNSIELGTNGVNPPGVADQSQTVEAGTPATVTLNAVSPNTNPLTYTIVTQPAHGTLAGAGSSETYTPVPFFTGTDTFTFKVDDGLADSITATMTLNVHDTMAPAISTLTPSLTQLWPVDHKMVDVNLDYSVSDLGDASPVCSLSISSNEPSNTTGDGNTSTDWEIVDAHHVRLRAERSGTGNGRVYSIGAQCGDRFGNLAQSANATVTVPKSQK